MRNFRSPLCRVSWHAHREEPLVPGHAEDGVVALGPARRGVDEGVDGLVQDGRGRGLVEHDLDVGGLEDLLVGVEGQAGQLALDEVGPVLRAKKFKVLLNLAKQN